MNLKPLLLALLACTANGDEIRQLLDEAKPPARFREHRANFRSEQGFVTNLTYSGTETHRYVAIKDGDRYVALFFPDDYGVGIELLTHDPALAPTTLQFPPRLHHATQFGHRMTGITWFDKWAVTGDKFEHEVLAKDDMTTITTRQVWLPTGKFGRTGESTHRFTLRCDPVLGYGITGSATLAVDKLALGKNGQPTLTYEFMNLLPPRLADPWPGRETYSYTVFSDAAQPVGRFTGWANNWVAAEKSDDAQPRNPVRDGGLVMFLSDTGWGYGMARTAGPGVTGLNINTCNVWQDQHNYFHLAPQPDGDGMYRAEVRFRTAFIPPEIVTHIRTNTQWRFADQTAVMPRLGRVEDFEDQPLSLTNATRGLRIEGLKLTDQAARSGRKAALVTAKPTPGRYDFFSIAPQIYCDPNSTYRIEAWVKVVGADTTAWISADTYEWTPHDPKRVKRQQTNVAAAGPEWQKLELEFTTPAHDIYVDLRWIAQGSGQAFFDDFQFVKVQP